jgi:hypothetical protein
MVPLALKSQDTVRSLYIVSCSSRLMTNYELAHQDTEKFFTHDNVLYHAY